MHDAAKEVTFGRAERRARVAAPFSLFVSSCWFRKWNVSPWTCLILLRAVTDVSIFDRGTEQLARVAHIRY